MIQERHKLLERTLEVDVVFPERVVGIDDQVLAVHCFGRGARWNGISKMASTSTATPSRSAGRRCGGRGCHFRDTVPSGPATETMNRQHLIVDADDTLWENNIY